MKSGDLKMKRIFLAILFVMIPGVATSGAELGMPAPAVVLPTLAGGETLDLANFRGKVVYVDFWASWCGPCRQSLPELDRLRRKYAENFEVFAINLDENPADGMRFLDKYPVTYPVVSDANARFPEQFGVMGMPTSYLLDRQGNVRFIHQGYRDGDAEKIEAVLKQLIAE